MKLKDLNLTRLMFDIGHNAPIMKDQYDNEVPSDLVWLSTEWAQWLNDDELRAIDRLDWYEPRTQPRRLFENIFVSEAELDKCLSGIFDFRRSEEFDSGNSGWTYIDRVLHRCNKINGWYHA